MRRRSRSRSEGRRRLPRQDTLLADLVAIVNAECRALVAAGAQFVQIEASQIVLEFANREHHLERLRVAPGG